MDPKQMLMLALMVSIMLTVFGFGLRASFGDLLYLVRHPGLLSRTLVSMFVIMPIAAMVLVSVFDLDPRVKIALVALAISPVPPMLPNKASKVEEEDGYPIALVATMALLSIVVAPIAINIVGRFAGQDLALPSSLVAKTVLKSALVPLLAGVVVRQFLPGVAARIAKPVSMVGGILLAIAALILLVVTASTLMAIATPKTLLAIAAFVIIGFVTGHLMGGQDHGHGAVLGLATATRHPGLAMAIATTNFPTERIGGVLLLYLLVGAIVGIPYVKWAKSRPAAASPRGGHPGVRPAGGSVR